MTPTKDNALLADRIESHVRFLANTRMEMPLGTWNAISNDLLSAASALRLASTVVEQVLQGIHDSINALGGTDDQNNSYDQGIVDSVAKALDIIEKAQASLTGSTSVAGLDGGGVG